MKADLAAAGARLELAHARRELPPDAERDRKIKGLQTRVRNLTAELRATQDRLNTKAVVMFDKERTAIIKALHADREPTATQRSAALSAFNSWWDRQSKKRPQR